MCEYVLARNNTIFSEKSHGGFVIGSEMSGGARKLVAVNNLFVNLERVLRIESNPRRGGFVEDVHFVNNVAVNVSEEFIVIHTDYDNETGDYPPLMRNIFVKNLEGIRGKYGVRIKGLEDSKITGIYLEDCVLEDVEFAVQIEHCKVRIRNSRIGKYVFPDATLDGRMEAR